MVDILNTYRFCHDDEARRRWQDPVAILLDIGLKPGFIFVDVGCGDGFFAIPAAKLVGDRGRVYGVDMDAEAIGRLRKRAEKKGLENLSLKVGEAENTVFCEGCADIVFLGIDLHDFREPHKVLRNTRKMLKLERRLVDLDWKKKPTNLGPPMSIRLSEKEASELIKDAGFKIDLVKDAGPHHYLIIAKP